MPSRISAQIFLDVGRSGHRKRDHDVAGEGLSTRVETAWGSLLRHYTLTVVSRSGSLSIKLRIYSCI